MSEFDFERRSVSEAPRDTDISPVFSNTRPCVLVIDDELLVLRSVVRTLSAYEVVAVTSAKEALALIDAGRAFDLILCDLMMPDMDGSQLYAHITRHRPDLCSRFVFMTGGAYSNEGREFMRAHSANQLEKPFDAVSIRACVETALSTR